MKLERLLQTHMAGLAALAAIMLGLGQRDFGMAFIMCGVALVSLIFTDALQIFRLHRLVANAAMLVAAFFTLNGFFEIDSYKQLVSIGQLLVAVQMTLLLQGKSYRIYGQIAVFSLLEVVVASLINGGLTFGILLILYTVVGVFALGFFVMHRETERAANPPSADSRVTIISRMEPDQLGRVILRNGLRWQMTWFSLATIIFAATFFYCTPRLGSSAWREGGFSLRSKVGFAPEITFDEMGKVLQNSELVMRVSFRDHRTNDPYTIIGEPYFRGAVLTRYRIDNGRARWKMNILGEQIDGDRLSRPKRTRELVRQEIALEDTGNERLFSVFPAYSTTGTPDTIRFHRIHRYYFRVRERMDSRQFRYSLVSTGFRFGTQIPFVPHVNPAASIAQRQQLIRENSRLSYIFLDDREPNRFRGLKALAAKIVKDNDAKTNHDKAKALEQWFLEDGRFTYSLDFDVINRLRDEKLDPVEDFVVNHRTGHCEYYASALTLMLRSQGIPARLIVGYKGGEYNYLGDYYLVRQSHAHAWVEAYLPPSQIPANTLDPLEIHAGGAWIRLDATPALDVDLLPAQQRSVLDRMNKSFDYAQWLWSDYVLRLTPEQQGLSVMDPLAGANSISMLEMLSSADLRERLNEALNPIEWVRQPIMRWLAVIISALILLSMVPRFWRVLPRLSWMPKFSRKKDRRTVRLIAYYQRLEKILAKGGLRRELSQTPREFAHRAHQQLLAAPLTAGVALTPNMVVELYYRERFGEQPPTTDRQHEIEEALTELDHAVRENRAEK